MWRCRSVQERMTERLQIYRCNVCGNIIFVLHAGRGELVCCGQPMELLAELTSGPGEEKHLPVIERTPEGVRVRVGSVAHPMQADHLIEWIEVIAGDEVHRRFLKPGEAPEAEFKLAAEGKVIARAYCSKHGLWKAELA